jgi:hypothetical protein
MDTDAKTLDRPRNSPMEQQYESDMVKSLEQLGIEISVSPNGTTLRYDQIYTGGTTFEEALIIFLAEVLSRYEALWRWKSHMSNSGKLETPDP